MKRKTRLILALVLVSLCARPAAAGRDPLNRAEIDQLRDAAPEPGKRLPLYVKFIKTRAATLEQLRSDPRFDAERVPQIHDLLEDIDTLLQEMDDNIDLYAERRADLRKPLKSVLEMDGALDLQLHTMKAAIDSRQTAAYGFALDNAIDSVSGSLDNARQLVQEQDETFKNAKQTK
jgi:hypothetical protein